MVVPRRVVFAEGLVVVDVVAGTTGYVLTSIGPGAPHGESVGTYQLHLRSKDEPGRVRQTRRVPRASTST